MRGREGDGRTLLAVKHDGTEVGADQLSEGTADQVFLALRLAGIAELQAERVAAGLPTLPVVLDDVLMTFDDARAATALTVLAELSTDWQVIVFSHHHHLAALALPAATRERLTVTELPAPLTLVEAPPSGTTGARTAGARAAAARPDTLDLFDSAAD